MAELLKKVVVTECRKRKREEEGKAAGSRSQSSEGILVHIELDQTLCHVERKWLLGQVATWKAISASGSSKTNTMRVRYRNPEIHLPIAHCDTTELEEVLKTLRFDESIIKPKWEKIPDVFIEDHIWDTKVQRFLQRALVDGFTNASGRNFVHSLLTTYLKGEGGKEPDIWNVGGRATPNNQMHPVYMTFSAENSPENLTITLRPKAPRTIVEDSYAEPDSNGSDEPDAICHIPVVDNMVYDPNQNRATLIVSVKTGSSFKQKDIEQLHHEMLSMLPLDGSKGHVGGILICQSLAEFRIAKKGDKDIELGYLTQFDFEDPDKKCRNFHDFVGYLISFYNYCSK